jgi:hypothetical protein
VGLKLSERHQLLIYADYVNLLEDNIDTIKINTETLTGASKVVGLEVNTEKTKYMLLSRHRNAGQNHDIKIANRCFENVAQLKYLGTTVTNTFIITLISKVLHPTISQPKSLKLLKIWVQKLKFTTCFGQYGHHQVLKCFVGETAAGLLLLLYIFPDAHACCSYCVLFLGLTSPRSR